MDTKEFEALKKKHESLMLKKAKQEARLESLQKEIETYKNQLEDMGITDLSNAESLLEEKELLLKKQYEELESKLAGLEDG